MTNPVSVSASRTGSSFVSPIRTLTSFGRMRFVQRRCKPIRWGAIILAFVLAAPTSGEARDIYKECNGGNDIAAIVSVCSAVLQRGARESASNRKQGFFYRGCGAWCGDGWHQLSHPGRCQVEE
jgi:hypothetical protein